MPTLPRLSGKPFITDAGLETCLIFKGGYELPSFASFVLLESEHGIEGLRAYYQGFLDIAERHGSGLVLDAATWRANPDWGEALGYDPASLAALNSDALALVAALRSESGRADDIALNLPIGPRGDGYRVDTAMSAEDARAYHRWQIDCAAGAGADMVTGLTMNYLEEAQGIALAAADVGIPCVISFTVETDGRLPTGMPLAEAIRRLDDTAGTDVSFYMINCAHPTHFAGVLGDSVLAERVGGIRANASRMSHAELDEAEELDEGNPVELGAQYREMLGALPHLCLLGGCCGTDHRHVAAVADACLPAMAGRG